MTVFRCMWSPSDFDAARRFLADVLALDLVTQWDDDGLGAIFQAPGAQIEIFGGIDGPDDDHPYRPVPGPGPLQLAMGWEVDDVDATVAAIAARGGVVACPPVDRPWGMRMAMVEGPDGLQVSLFSWEG